MKNVFRIVITFLAFIASYFFLYWISFFLLPIAHNYAFIPNVISLLIALVIGFFVYKNLGKISNGLVVTMLLGGMIIGAFGFIVGFIGPMIITPGANQGPLLGILFTGPIGFILGLIGGGIYWKVKRKYSIPKTEKF